MIEVHSLSAIDHVLRHNPTKLLRLTFSVPFDKLNPRQKNLSDLARAKKIQIDFGGRFDKNSDGVTAQLKPFEYTELKPFLTKVTEKPKSIVLALDHLQDPQNFGALARSAEAFGVDGIIIPKDRSVGVTSGAYNASVGALETIPIIQVSNLAESLKRFKEKDYWIVGSSIGENAKPLKETPTFEKVVLVMGTELEGISNHIKETCDWLTYIPMQGKIDSLNVSAAGAVLIHFFSSRS